MHAELRARNPPAMRNGGLNCLLRPELEQYFSDVEKQTLKLGISVKKPLKDGHGKTVVAFYDTVRRDPTLKMCIEGGLSQVPKGGGLYNTSFEFMCDQILYLVITPPKATYSSLDGVPFYTLFVDLLETKGGMGFFINPIVNDHLKDIFNEYAWMLTRPQSLLHLTTDRGGGWLYEDKNPNVPNDQMTKPTKNIVDYNRFQCDPKNLPNYGFKCWMDWFARKLKPEYNKVPINDNENMILSSSDSFPLYYPIPPLPQGRNDVPDLGRNPTYNVKMDTPFWLKDNQYSLIDMFDAINQEENHGRAGFVDFIKTTFEEGTVFQSFLNPWCYHRWQTPIAGTIRHSYKAGGTYYLQNPSKGVNIRKDNYVDSQPLLTAVSVRQIYIIEADNKNIGHVAVIEIGMAEVSSVNTSVDQGQHVNKTDELGYFAFGGSSYALVFSNNIKKEENAKMGEWYFKWADKITKLEKPDGKGWQYQLPAPGKILVNEEVCTIHQRI